MWPLLQVASAGDADAAVPGNGDSFSDEFLTDIDLQDFSAILGDGAPEGGSSMSMSAGSGSDLVSDVCVTEGGYVICTWRCFSLYCFCY